MHGSPFSLIRVKLLKKVVITVPISQTVRIIYPVSELSKVKLRAMQLIKILSHLRPNFNNLKFTVFEEKIRSTILIDCISLVDISWLNYQILIISL